MVHLLNVARTDWLFHYLGDEAMLEFDSDEVESRYLYRCGCYAVRKVESDHSNVTWCDTHRIIA